MIDFLILEENFVTEGYIDESVEVPGPTVES